MSSFKFFLLKRSLYIYTTQITITIYISNNGRVICFSLEHGKDYHLYIPVIDNDGDETRCSISSYIEAGGLLPLTRELESAESLSIDEMVNIKNPP